MHYLKMVLISTDIILPIVLFIVMSRSSSLQSMKDTDETIGEGMMIVSWATEYSFKMQSDLGFFFVMCISSPFSLFRSIVQRTETVTSAEAGFFL